MRHVHADMMHRVAEDTTLKVFYKDGGDWISLHLEDITWSPECQYKIEEPRKEPVMPDFLFNNNENDLIKNALRRHRERIEAYWKKLDEYNGLSSSDCKSRLGKS
mgnify:CR=1 FL=1